MQTFWIVLAVAVLFTFAYALIDEQISREHASRKDKRSNIISTLVIVAVIVVGMLVL